MLVYNCQIKTPTSELNSNYMIHVHTEIVVAEGLQECGNHSSINNTRIVLDHTGSDHGLDYRLEGVSDQGLDHVWHHKLHHGSDHGSQKKV